MKHLKYLFRGLIVLWPAAAIALFFFGTIALGNVFGERFVGVVFGFVAILCIIILVLGLIYMAGREYYER